MLSLAVGDENSGDRVLRAPCQQRRLIVLNRNKDADQAIVGGREHPALHIVDYVFDFTNTLGLARINARRRAME